MVDEHAIYSMPFITIPVSRKLSFQYAAQRPQVMCVIRLLLVPCCSLAKNEVLFLREHGLLSCSWFSSLFLVCGDCVQASTYTKALALDYGKCYSLPLVLVYICTSHSFILLSVCS